MKLYFTTKNSQKYLLKSEWVDIPVVCLQTVTYIIEKPV